MIPTNLVIAWRACVPNNLTHWVRTGSVATLLALFAATSLSAADTKSVRKGPISDAEWKITIVPSVRVASAQNSPEAPVAVGDAAPETRPAILPLYPQRSYAEVYRSIPFSRAEYDANRSYRHEATMELLFGQLRPMVIHKNQPSTQRAPRRRGFQRLTPYQRYTGRYGYYYANPLRVNPLFFRSY